MSARYQTTQSGGQDFASAVPRGRRLWLYIVPVAIVALVALGPKDGELSREANQAESNQDVTAAAPDGDQPVFDGRGKWGGYAR